jgi:hypothetical protein
MATTRDPRAALQEAAMSAKQGNYEEALRDHLWFHEHALEQVPALAGVRLSFALAAWVKLGGNTRRPCRP